MPVGLEPARVEGAPRSSCGSRFSASSFSAVPPADASGSSLSSTYARRKPGNVIVRPDVVNTTDSSVIDVPPMRTDTVVPTASDICEASVRCQMSS